jgi:hypothetical protein
MPIKAQNKTAIENLIERIFHENKDRGYFRLLKQQNKNTSVQVLYRPGSKRPEEHFFQYFT